MEDEKDNLEVTFEQAFGWYGVINRISQDDFTKHNQIVQATVMEALNQLHYLIQKDQELIRIQKKMSGKF